MLRENLALQAVTLDRMGDNLRADDAVKRPPVLPGRFLAADPKRRQPLGHGPVERLARAYAGRQGPRPPPPPRQDPWATMLYRDTADPA